MYWFQKFLCIKSEILCSKRAIKKLPYSILRTLKRTLISINDLKLFYKNNLNQPMYHSPPIYHNQNFTPKHCIIFRIKTTRPIQYIKFTIFPRSVPRCFPGDLISTWIPSDKLHNANSERSTDKKKIKKIKADIFISV